MGFDLLLFLAELRAQGFIDKSADLDMIADGLKPATIEILIRLHDKINGYKEIKHSEL